MYTCFIFFFLKEYCYGQDSSKHTQMHLRFLLFFSNKIRFENIRCLCSHNNNNNFRLMQFGLYVEIFCGF